MTRRGPQPPPKLPDAPGAPKWAVMIRETWRGLESMATWWLENRLVANGEWGGGVNDDTDLFQAWQCLPMIESEPLGAALKDAAARLAELASEHKLEEGLNKRTMDALHAYEEGVNQLALCAWWFYGDPVHFERAMISARSAAKLMVATEDGRVHFGSKYLGVENVRHGYEKLGASPGTFNWAPARLFLHPLYVAAMYSRGSAALARFERWGQTWAGYQQPNAFADKVDIKTGKPIRVTKLPPSANIGPVVEWLTLYQLTGDPKWHRVFKMGIDGKGYSGAPVQYGRCPHALVAWEEPYRSFMRRKFSGPDSGYAGFFVTRDRSKLDNWLARSASWYGRFRHMHSAAEQKTDRILTYRATTPIACYLGDAPNRNRWLNLTAVSYEGLRGEDFAALVWDAGPDVLRVAIYSFADKPLEGRVRVWRLDHGHYRVRIGPDANDDGAIDKAAEERTMELQRHSPIELTLPPRQVTVLKVEQLAQLDDIRVRADLALSPIDTRLGKDGGVEVKVHNIGAKPAQKVRVVLERNGRTAAERSVDAIEAPLDMTPRVATVRFASVRTGDTIVVDPDNEIPEIAESNNRLTVSAPPE